MERGGLGDLRVYAGHVHVPSLRKLVHRELPVKIHGLIDHVAYVHVLAPHIPSPSFGAPQVADREDELRLAVGADAPASARVGDVMQRIADVSDGHVMRKKGRPRHHPHPKPEGVGGSSGKKLGGECFGALRSADHEQIVVKRNSEARVVRDLTYVLADLIEHGQIPVGSRYEPRTSGELLGGHLRPSFRDPCGYLVGLGMVHHASHGVSYLDHVPLGPIARHLSSARAKVFMSF